MDTEQFKAILIYRESGEVKWTYEDYERWSDVRKDAGQLIAEACDNSANIEVKAVSNHGHTLEVSKEEDCVSM